MKKVDIKVTILIISIGFLIFSINSNIISSKSEVQNNLKETSIEINVRNINIGKIQKKKDAVGEFYIKNTGSENLLINNIEVSCTCSSIGLPEDTIVPGDSTRILVKYNKGTIGYFYSDVLVHGNFPGSPEILSFEGNLVVNE